MKRFLPCALLLALLWGGFQPDVTPLSAAVITENGRSDYQILLPAAPTPAERQAASELQSCLKAMTGVELKIVSEADADVDSGSRFLAVGQTKLASARIPFDALKDDEIRLEALPNGTLFLAGDAPRGTLYSVYVFLEKFGGVRWWSPDFTQIPSRPNLVIPDSALPIAYAPQLISREVYHRLAWNVPFAAHNRLNGHHHRHPAELGGNLTLLNFVHSFYRYLPPETYFAEHPEWYAEVKGKRTCEHSQLCLTNEEMTAEFIKNVLESLRKNPGTKIIDVSQNDCFGYCTCPKCRALDEAEGGPSGCHFTFINRVAEAVEKEFPDVLVETLAYQYSRKPPKTIQLRPNVLVRLCSIECSFLKPLNDSTNQAFADDIAGWRKIAKQLFIWDYVTNYSDYVGPFPNLRAIGPNIQYFVANGAVGLFEEGEGDDFVEMRNWVLAQLQWDPSQDSEALQDEFLAGFYGPKVAPILRDYLNLLHDRAEKVNLHLGCFNALTSAWLDLATLNRASELMNQALKASGEAYGTDSPEFRHLRKSALAIESVWVYRYDSLKTEARRLKIPFGGPDDPEKATRKFAEECREFKIAGLKIGQKGGIEPSLEGLIENFTARSVPPEFCRDLPKDSWLAFSALGFANVSNAAEIVPDAESCSGKSVKMGTKVDWNTQFSPEFTGRFRVFAALRCEGTEREKRLGSWGIYDVNGKKGVATQPLTAEQFLLPDGTFDRKFRWIDLGSVEIPAGAYLWFAHAHSEKLEAIFVDRVVFVIEEE